MKGPIPTYDLIQSCPSGRMLRIAIPDETQKAHYGVTNMSLRNLRLVSNPREFYRCACCQPSRPVAVDDVTTGYRAEIKTIRLVRSQNARLDICCISAMVGLEQTNPGLRLHALVGLSIPYRPSISSSLGRRRTQCCSACSTQPNRSHDSP